MHGIRVMSLSFRVSDRRLGVESSRNWTKKEHQSVNLWLQKGPGMGSGNNQQNTGEWIYLPKSLFM